MLSEEQTKAKIKEMIAARAQLVQQVAAHDGYIQCLHEMLAPEKESEKPAGNLKSVAK